MASSEKKPRKGILKTSTSFDKAEPTPRSKEMKWDEMNILATHHPPDKDYGHMKIDEPPTPYSKYSDPEDDDTEGNSERRGSVGQKSKLDPSSLSTRLEGIEGPRLRRVSTEDEEDSSEEEDNLSEEQMRHRKEFQQKRKLHYNEFQAVQLAKQLMEEDDDDEEDETGDEDGNVGESVQMQTDQAIDLANTGANNISSSGTSGRKLAETTMDSSGQLETKIN